MYIVSVKAEGLTVYTNDCQIDPFALKLTIYTYIYYALIIIATYMNIKVIPLTVTYNGTYICYTYIYSVL